MTHAIKPNEVNFSKCPVTDGNILARVNAGIVFAPQAAHGLGKKIILYRKESFYKKYYLKIAYKVYEKPPADSLTGHEMKIFPNAADNTLYRLGRAYFLSPSYSIEFFNSSWKFWYSGIWLPTSKA